MKAIIRTILNCLVFAVTAQSAVAVNHNPFIQESDTGKFTILFDLEDVELSTEEGGDTLAMDASTLEYELQFDDPNPNGQSLTQITVDLEISNLTTKPDENESDAWDYLEMEVAGSEGDPTIVSFSSGTASHTFYVTDFEGGETYTIDVLGIYTDGTSESLGNAITVSLACASCEEECRSPGGYEASNESVSLSFGVGAAENSKRGAELAFYSEFPMPNLADPSNLSFTGGVGYEVIGDANISNQSYINVYEDLRESERNTAAPSPAIEQSADLEFEANALAAGDYYLWLRTRAYDNQSESLWLTINGNDEAIPVHANTGTEWQWTQVAGPLSLSAGNHLLSFRLREPGLQIDRIVLTDQDPSQFSPVGVADFPVSGSFANLEAESALVAGDAEPFYVVSDASVSGASYVDTIAEVLDSDLEVVDLAITLPNLSIADYKVWALVNAPDGHSDSVFYSLDATNFELWQWQPSTVESWALLPELLSVTSAGDHYLTLGFRESGLGLNQFLVQSLDSASTDGTGMLALEAEFGAFTGALVTVDSASPLTESNAAYLDGTTGFGSTTEIGDVNYAFTVSAADDGDYRLFARIKVEAGSPGLAVSMNSDPALTWQPVAASTWTWQVLEVSGSDVFFNLATGSHSLKLDFDGSGILIDRLILSSDSAFAPQGLENNATIVEAESAIPAYPFALTDGGDAVMIEEASVFNATFSRGDSARYSTASLAGGSYYLWARGPLSIAEPKTLWLSTQDEAEIWELAFDAAYHGSPAADADWVWHRYPMAVEVDAAHDLALFWRDRGLQLDALLLTMDSSFDPNAVSDIADVSTQSQVSTYFEAESADSYSFPLEVKSTIEQVVSSTALLDIRKVADGYYLDYYYRPVALVEDSDGKYELPDASEKFKSFYVYDSGGLGESLTVERDGNEVAEFIWNDSLQDWTLSEGDGLVSESAVTTLSEDETVETRTITKTNASGELSSEVVEVYEQFDFGRKLVSRTVDPNGRNLTTNYSYYPKALPGSGGPTAGMLRSVLRPNGNWTTYDYSGSRMTKLVTQYLNSSLGDEPNSKVTTYAYSDTTGLSGVSKYRESAVTVMGVETARSYRFTRELAAGAYEKWSITAVAAGAAWNAAGNSVTRSLYTADFLQTKQERGYMNGLGDSIDVEHLTLYNHETTVDFAGETAYLKTITSGQPNAAGNAVLSGRKTETYIRDDSNITSWQLEYRIENSTEYFASQWMVTGLDAFQRTTEKTWYADIDGTELLYTTATSYNCCNMASQTDQYGVTTYYGYDSLDRRVTSTRLGVTMETVYDANGRAVETKRYPEGQPNQAVVLSKSSYNLAGELTAQSERTAASSEAFAETSYTTTIRTETDSLGEAVAAGEKRVINFSDGGVAVTESAGDGSILLQYGSTSQATGMDYSVDGGAIVARTTLLEYDAGGDSQNPNSVEEASSYTNTAEWTEHYSEMGRMVKMHYADGAESINAYDAKGRLQSSTDADGIRTLYAYNSKGERYQTAIDVDQDGLIGTGATDLDRVSETERLITTRIYDSTTYNVQRSISKVWTDDGLVTTAINDRSLDGRRAWAERFGQVSYTETIDSDTTDGDWSVKSVGPDGSYTVQSYTNGRLSATTQYDRADAQLASTSTTYDALGRQEFVTDSRTGSTQLTYYDNDALASTIAPDPDAAGPLGTLLTQYIYDDMGRQIQVILPDATSTYTVYNVKGQVEKTYGSQQNPVEYTYDYAGRQETMTTWQDFNESTGTGTSGSAVTTWVYNPQRGWLDRKEYDDAKGTDYTYTDAGRLASRTWARGDVTHYAYNSAGDLLAVDYSDAGTPDIHYTYTRTGQQHVVSEGQFGSNAFTAGSVHTPSLSPSLSTAERSSIYDLNDRFQVETETVSGLLANDAVLTRTYEDGTETNGLLGRGSGYSLSVSSAISAVNYTYDPAGRLQTVSDGTDTFTYGYTPNTVNLLASLTSPVHTATYSYESGRNAMTGIENKETVGTDSVVSNYSYTYNELGQRADREQSGSAFASTNKDTFSYDYLGQVTASSNDTLAGTAYNPTYAYDEIGNRTGNTMDLNGTTSYTQDLLNQYTAVGASTPQYDDDGNLTGKGVWTYSWNGENRLSSASNGSTTIDFLYDYQGRLIEKDDGTNVEVYLYDGWNRIAKYVNGSHSKSYLWGLDLSGSMQGAGGVGGLLKEGSLYPTYDANGNITQKLDSNGLASMAVEYDPFGNIISGTLIGDYGFSTKPFVDDIDWYYYGFRYYDPVTGRWPSRDPIEEQGGLNLYAMVDNDPVNYWDLLGQQKPRIDWEPPSNRDGYIPASPFVDGKLADALDFVMSSCFLSCWIAGLSEEDYDGMIQEITDSVPYDQRDIFTNWVSGLPGSAGQRFIVVANSGHRILARTPQKGAGVVGIVGKKVVPQSVKRQVVRTSVRAVGANGVKYFGRVGSKVIPVLGQIFLAVEVANVCKCKLACDDDGKFTDDEKFFN